MKLQTVFLPFFLPFLSIPAHANRALMESTTATAFTMFVDTGNTQVDVGTNTYGGGLKDVKLYVSSHLVVGSDNACVFFSTGSWACKGSGGGSAGSMPWIRSGVNVILNNSADGVAIGASAPQNGAKFSVSGKGDIEGTSILNGLTGINTTGPSTDVTLDVNGAAEFGSGVTKSTFSSIGSLTLANNAALTVNTGPATVFNTTVTFNNNFNGSQNVIGFASLSIAALGPCRSTITFTSNGGLMNYVFSGEGSSAAAKCIAGILVDSLPIGNETSTTGFGEYNGTATGFLGFNVTFTASAGPHSVCLQVASLDAANSCVLCGGNISCLFGAWQRN